MTLETGESAQVGAMLAHWPVETAEMHDGAPILECGCGKKWYGNYDSERLEMRLAWAKHAEEAVKGSVAEESVLAKGLAKYGYVNNYIKVMDGESEGPPHGGPPLCFDPTKEELVHEVELFLSALERGEMHLSDLPQELRAQLLAVINKYGA